MGVKCAYSYRFDTLQDRVRGSKDEPTISEGVSHEHGNAGDSGRSRGNCGRLQRNGYDTVDARGHRAGSKDRGQLARADRSS